MTRYFRAGGDGTDVTQALIDASESPGAGVELLLQETSGSSGPSVAFEWRPAASADVRLGSGYPLAGNAPPVRLPWPNSDDHLVVWARSGSVVEVAVTVI